MYRSHASCSACLAVISISKLLLSTCFLDTACLARPLERAKVPPIFEPPASHLVSSPGPTHSREASPIRSIARHVGLPQRGNRGPGPAIAGSSFAQGGTNSNGDEQEGSAPAARQGGFLARVRDASRRWRNRGRREVKYPFIRAEEQEPGSDAVAALVRKYIIPHQPELRDTQLKQAFDQWLPAGEPFQFKTLVGWLSKSRTLLLQRGRFLGRGKFGVVFEVTDQKTGERFALKASVVSAEHAQLEMQVFEEELDNGRLLGFRSTKEVFDRCRFIVPLMKLKRPGEPSFVKTRDGRALGNRFLLSALAEGSLRELIRRSFTDKAGVQQLGADVARMSVSLQLLRLGAILQALGIVHADINPNNLLLSGDGLLYLADFGAVYKAGTRALPISHTLLYSPPEVLAARGQMDFTVDSWEIGCTVHEIWCNRVPYESRDLKIVRRGDGLEGYDRTPPFPTVDLVDFAGCLASMPQSIRNLVQRLVRLDPEKRLRLLDVEGDADFLQAQARLLGKLADWTQQEARGAPRSSAKI